MTETEEPPKKRRMLRKFLIFLLVLIAGAGPRACGGVAGRHRLRRSPPVFCLRHGGGGQGKRPSTSYDTDNTNRFARGGGPAALVILSDTSLRLLGPDGSEVWSANVKMNAPALGQGGGLAVAYDIGGTALYVLDEERRPDGADRRRAAGLRQSQRLRDAGRDHPDQRHQGPCGRVRRRYAGAVGFQRPPPLCGGCLRDGGRRLFGRW